MLSCPASVPLSAVLAHLSSQHAWPADSVHPELGPPTPTFSSHISTTAYLHSVQVMSGRSTFYIYILKDETSF